MMPEKSTPKGLTEFQGYQGDPLERGLSQRGKFSQQDFELYDAMGPDNTREFNVIRATWTNGYISGIGAALEWAIARYNTAHRSMPEKKLPELGQHHSEASRQDMHALHECLMEALGRPVEIQGVKGTSWDLVSTASSTTPDSTIWHAAHFLLRWKELLKHFEDDFGNGQNSEPWNMSQREALEVKHFELIKKGFEIGFLFRDAFWKENHEEAAIKAYNSQAKNAASAPKGGEVQAARKAERYRILNEWATSQDQRFSRMSDTHRTRAAMTYATTFDKRSDSDTKLFQRRGKFLSRRWFEGWLADYCEISASSQQLIKK